METAGWRVASKRWCWRVAEFWLRLSPASRSTWGGILLPTTRSLRLSAEAPGIQNAMHDPGYGFVSPPTFAKLLRYWLVRVKLEVFGTRSKRSAQIAGCRTVRCW